MTSSAAGIEAVGERIVDQERGHLQKARIADPWIPLRGGTKALQCAQIIRIAQLTAQLLEDVPVTVTAVGAEFRRQVRAQVVLHGIVVEQRIVDIQQERHRRDHGATPGKSNAIIAFGTLGAAAKMPVSRVLPAHGTPRAS